VLSFLKQNKNIKEVDKITEEIFSIPVSLKIELKKVREICDSLALAEARVRELIASIYEKTQRFNETSGCLFVDTEQMIPDWNPHCTFGSLDETVHFLVRRVGRREGVVGEAELEKMRCDLQEFLMKAFDGEETQIEVEFTRDCLGYEPKKYGHKKKETAESDSCSAILFSIENQIS